MKILVFGNETYEPDSLPLKLLPELRHKFPDVEFVVADPNEDWAIEGDVTAIDTVINLTEPRVFNSLTAFEESPRVSMHDFDALAQLRLLQKLKKISGVQIFGLPPNMVQQEALKWLDTQLTANHH